MPIYEYRCQDCEEEFEVMQKISARPLRKCRACGGRLEKLLSQTSFVLRGSGWYADGYGGGAKKKKKTADGKTPPAGGEKGAGDTAKKSPSGTGSGSKKD